MVTRATKTFKSSPATATAGPFTKPVSKSISGTTNMAPLVVVKPSHGPAKSWVSGVTAPGAPLSYMPMVHPVEYWRSGKEGINAGLISHNHGDAAMADWKHPHVPSMPAAGVPNASTSEYSELRTSVALVNSA